MKKLPFLIAFVILVKLSVAQCTPDQNMGYGFSPMSLTDGMVGVSYSQVILFKIPVDTTVGGYSGTISSGSFNSILDLPAGLSYTCNKSPGACTYTGGEAGCITVSGVPTQVYDKSMTLKLTVSGILHGPGQLETPLSNMPLEPTVAFKVVASNGLSVVKAPFFAVSQREDNLVVLNAASGKLSVEIYDMLGREVKSAVFQSFKGESSSMNISTLEKGIYFVNLQLNGKQETIKISKGFY